MTIVDVQPTTPSPAAVPSPPTALELVVPSYAGACAEATIRELRRYLSTEFPLPCRLTIVDAAAAGDGVDPAVFAAWTRSDATVLATIDPTADLDHSALLPLVASVLSGHSDLAIATPGGQPAEAPGLLAIRADRLGPDPDVLGAAVAADLRIHRVPVGPRDEPGSRNPRHHRRLGRQVKVFATIGVLSTLAYVVLFVLFRGALGPFGANTLALALTAIANTAANRRFTFGVTDSAGRLRHQIQGLLVFALTFGLTTGSLAALHAATTHASRAVEVATLLVANLTATALRFVMLRQWVFRASTRPAPVLS